MLARTPFLAIVLAVAMAWAGSASAQTEAAKADSTRAGAASAQKKPAKPPGKMFYGGGVSFTFGSQTRVSVSPLIGYQLSPMFSIGTQINFEYLKQEIDFETRTMRNYGMSLFGRLHVKNFYAHLEPAWYSQEVIATDGTRERDAVPYLFVGGGAFYPIAPRMRAYIQVTFDLLQDDRSPYKGGEQFVTTGIALGP